MHDRKRTCIYQCSVVILSSLAYDAVDITDDDNYGTAPTAKIYVCVVLMTIVRNIFSIALARRWVITMQKAQTPIQVSTQKNKDHAQHFIV